MQSEDPLRAWTLAPRDESIAALGEGVVVCRSRPDSTGRRRLRQLVQLRAEGVEPLSPDGWDCWKPVLVAGVQADAPPTVLCLTDAGKPDHGAQVAARLESGEWRAVSDAAGTVVDFVASSRRVVALERVRRADSPWQAEVAVAEGTLAGHWDRWLTEDTLQLVVYDRLTGVRMPLGVPRSRLLEDCALALSRDGRTLAFTERRMGSDGVLERTLTIRSLPGQERSFRVGDADCCDHSHPVFSPDGRRLAFVRHPRGPGQHGRKQLWVVDGTAGLQFPVASELPHWIEPQHWTAEGLLGLATIGAHRRVLRVNPGNDTVELLDAPGLSWQALAVGRRVVGLASSLHQRPHARVVGDGPLGAVPAPVELPAVESWSMPRHRCPALWLPTAASGARPLLLLVHGGPISAWRDEWHPRQTAARFAGLGAHLLLANPRGSIGHGDAHVEGVWQQWGRAVDDLVGLLREAVLDPRVDPERVAVLGGSFGGWAVNRLATRPDVPSLRAVVTHAGIVDHRSMYGSCDEPGAWAWHLGGRPHRREERLRADEPFRHLHRWRAPTLITHGARDHNVPVGQALQLHTALLDRQVDSRLVVFPTEGHHILEPRNEVRWWEEVLGFLGHHLHASERVEWLS